LKECQYNVVFKIISPHCTKCITSLSASEQYREQCSSNALHQTLIFYLLLVIFFIKMISYIHTIIGFNSQFNLLDSEQVK